jgi:4-amino-4-deoxychorismate lyase
VILIDGTPDNRISPLDRGLAYGDGVFRTMRIRDGRVMQWSRHYAKLAHDCMRLGLTCPPQDLLTDELGRVAVDHPEGVARITVTRGPAERGYAPPDLSRPTRVVSSFAHAATEPSRAGLGVHARWCRTSVTVQRALAGVKHLNRLDSVLARSEWRDSDIAEGLMADPDGWVIQGTMSNVFLLEGERLATPLLDTAGVAGVQRERLMSKCAGAGLHCAEDRISRERLLAADAVFLTNSVIGLWWISRLETRVWSPHPVTARLIGLLDSHADE